MERKVLSFDFFDRFQNREAFFEEITTAEVAPSKLTGLGIWLFLFSFIYGLVMGSYNSALQALSAGVKVPLLFALVMLICIPAFYTIQFILGSKLRFAQILAILLTGFVLSAAIMVSFAPIVLFFLITGGNYAFLKLLHVGIFTFAGVFGMKTIIDALKYACDQRGIYPKIGVQIFRLWAIIMAFVGMQLAWNLRPFLGSQDQPFELFRSRGGNFYLAVLRATGEVLGFRGQGTGNKAKRAMYRSSNNPEPAQGEVGVEKGQGADSGNNSMNVDSVKNNTRQ